METYADANAAHDAAIGLEWRRAVRLEQLVCLRHGRQLLQRHGGIELSSRATLQTNNFNNQGVVYINLDSFWSNLSDAQLQQFANYCHSNGQKAGIYWTPFVYWGTARQGSNSFMTGSGTYKWSDAYLRTPNGSVQTIDGGIAIDPTHPGFKQMTAYYINYFKSHGFDYLKLDFLTHGALEGVHYDTNVTTGIQAYNQGMQYLVQQNNGRMFLSESIAPIFPYQYAHSRRIYCDAATSISDTANTMQAVSLRLVDQRPALSIQRSGHDEILGRDGERKPKPADQLRHCRNGFSEQRRSGLGIRTESGADLSDQCQHQRSRARRRVLPSGGRQYRNECRRCFRAAGRQHLVCRRVQLHRFQHRQKSEPGPAGNFGNLYRHGFVERNDFLRERHELERESWRAAGEVISAWFGQHQRDRSNQSGAGRRRFDHLDHGASGLRRSVTLEENGATMPGRAPTQLRSIR